MVCSKRYEVIITVDRGGRKIIKRSRIEDILEGRSHATVSKEIRLPTDR